MIAAAAALLKTRLSLVMLPTANKGPTGLHPHRPSRFRTRLGATHQALYSPLDPLGCPILYHNLYMYLSLSLPLYTLCPTVYLALCVCLCMPTWDHHRHCSVLTAALRNILTSLLISTPPPLNASLPLLSQLSALQLWPHCTIWQHRACALGRLDRKQNL